MSKRIAADHIKLKRAYEPAAPDDGTRILIDRLWPRGVKKADAAIDEWMKDIAPTRRKDDPMPSRRSKLPVHCRSSSTSAVEALYKLSSGYSLQ